MERAAGRAVWVVGAVEAKEAEGIWLRELKVYISVPGGGLGSKVRDASDTGFLALAGSVGCWPRTW